MLTFLFVLVIIFIRKKFLTIFHSRFFCTSRTDWKQLEKYLGMSGADTENTGWRGTDEGGKLKEAGFDHWQNPNLGASNESGFSALPAGFRDVSNGNFGGMGNYANFWSSTENDAADAWYHYLSYGGSGVYRYFYPRDYGFSVRS